MPAPTPSLLTRMNSAVDWRLWQLAGANLVVAGSLLQYLQYFLTRFAANPILNGVIEAQLVLLALAVALLLRRSGIGVFAILLVCGLLSLLSQPGRVRLQMFPTTMKPVIFLAVLHALRFCFGWRITRARLSDLRPAQFQTIDLLEWTFLIATVLGVASTVFTQLGYQPTASEWLAAGIYFATYLLLGVPLTGVLLRERIELRWLLGVVVLWAIVLVAVLCWDSWDLSKTLWPKRSLIQIWLKSAPAYAGSFAVTTVLNSLTLRWFGYRWRSPVAMKAASLIVE